MAASEMLLLL